MIEKYLAAETDKLSKKFLDGAKTLAEWQKKRPRLYREYMDMLGLWPIPEKTPLKVTLTGFVEGPDFVIDKLHFQSKPGLYVTANLYRPLDSDVRARNGKRLPAVLYLCGHSGRGRDGNKTAFQDHGMWFAKNGYICLILDTLQLGEIPGVHHGTYGRPWNHLKAYGIKDKDVGETRWWWHSAGYTPAGVECWNGVRAIDYLVSRPDVDAGKIAVTGISGGGASTFWVAAADERVKCAVPVSGMSDLESYVKNKVINGHCDCMFLYNTYQWDWTTIAALVAPGPMLFANSDNDGIFPMDGNRRIIAKLRQLYKMHDKPELVDEYISVGGHDYRPDLRIAIFKWINKHVKNDTGPVKDADYAPYPGKMLRVFREDDEIPKDVINGKVDETFARQARVKLPEPGKFKEWRENLFLALKASPFGRWHMEIVASWQPQGKHLGEVVIVYPEPGIDLEMWGTGGTAKNDKLWTVIVADPKEKVKEFEKLSNLVGDGCFLVMRGQNHPSWTKKSPPNYVERTHALLGRTVDQGRVWDIIASVRYNRAEFGKKNMRVFGFGQAGILAAYAALFEPSIKEVVIADPPKSHKEGPHFLGVLRVLDIPEALGLLAPNVKLTLINGRDSAFDRTEEIYRLAGARDKLIRK